MRTKRFAYGASTVNPADNLYKYIKPASGQSTSCLIAKLYPAAVLTKRFAYGTSTVNPSDNPYKDIKASSIQWPSRLMVKP